MKLITTILSIACLFLSASALAECRDSVFAGAFYPESATLLKKMAGEYIANAKVEKDGLPQGQLMGIISPHAGYPYSGPVAGYAYKLLEGQTFDTVIVLGPNHRLVGFNSVSVWNKGSFKTPLGEIPIDIEMADAIIKENPTKFIFHPNAHSQEHSIEVQLPFLQIALKDFKLVPIVVGDYSQNTCKELASAIFKSIGNKKVLIVASTDLSHDKLYDKAVTMDKLGLGYAVNLDIDSLAKAERDGKTEMCGYGPVLILLYAAKEMGCTEGILLKYANSGDTTNDKNGRIVGYGAVAFFKTQIGTEDKTQIGTEKNKLLVQANTNKEGEGMQNGAYTMEEKKALLKLARGAIMDCLSGAGKSTYPVFSEKFNEPRGVFVTLNKHGDLRGCIGYIEPIKSLHQAVIDNAINSATQDPRFPEVNVKELPDIEIEISVLTPPKEVNGPEDFIVGKHGIIIRKGFYSAVFLPQVAPEQGWTREETLSHLCLKAGLPTDEWKKPGMKFLVFTAEVFNEKEVK